MNHMNFNNLAGVLKGDKDNYFSTDLMRDFWSHRESTGQVFSNLTGGTNQLFSQAGQPVQGTGYTVNIPVQTGVVRFAVTVPQDYSTYPPVLVDKDIFILVTSTTQTNLSVSTAVIGQTNYIKLRYTETETTSRTKQHDSSTWNSEVIPSFSFVIDNVTPTQYDLQIATFTTNGSTLTFTNYTSPVSVNIVNKADDSTVVHKAGTETITGTKNYTSIPMINNKPILTNIATGTGSIMIGDTISSSNSSVGLGIDSHPSATGCTAIGTSSYASDTYAIAIGSSANAAAVKSIAIGSPATSAGSHSIALGNAGSSPGDYSVSIGTECVSGGNSSTAMGYYASSGGDYATCVGSYTTGSYSYSGALGYGATSGGSNEIRIGNNSAIIHMYSAEVIDSDKRLKENIIETPLGLNFVNKIQASQYTMKNSIQEIIKDPEVKDKKGNIVKKAVIETLEHKHSRPHQGFIADQIKEVIDELGIDFAGYKDSKIDGGEDKKGLAYAEFIPPLYKAVQELHKIVLDQQETINSLIGLERQERKLK